MRNVNVAVTIILMIFALCIVSFMSKPKLPLKEVKPVEIEILVGYQSGNGGVQYFSEQN